MRLIADNHIELSYANAKALVEAFERGEYAPRIHKATNEGVVISVTVAADADHYTEAELAARRSPYLPPEAWAGV